MTVACAHCSETIGAGEFAPSGGLPLHVDCLLRMVVGGLNHQRGLCLCCGGDQQPDPPSLSRREAARVAAMHYRRTLA